MDSREQKMKRLENSLKRIKLEQTWWSFHELVQTCARVFSPADGLSWDDMEEVLDKIFPPEEKQP